MRIDTPTQVCQISSPKRRIRVTLQAIYMSLADCCAIDAYVIGDSTMDYLFPTWPAKILVPIGFTIWFFRLFIELIGYLRLAINVNAEPIYVPIIKTAEELANEEIKSIRE